MSDHWPPKSDAEWLVWYVDCDNASSAVERMLVLMEQGWTAPDIRAQLRKRFGDWFDGD